MKLRQDIDFSTLNWVKDELDETLRQARQALDAYSEDPDDASQMRFCATYLHQAQGTLRMVELYGAALLVEEMETVALGLLEGTVTKSDDVFGVLMRALVQLPDYLERLEGGHRDIPVVLLPLLNDLRSARGAKLLSENVLFSPDLSSPLPQSAAGPELPVAPASLKPAVARLRSAFELALLRWIKDDQSAPALERIGAVIDRFQRVTHNVDIRRLWWVCGGLVETLRNHSFDSLVSHKLLFGRIDRTMRDFVEKGEAALAATPPESLTCSVLYYVAQVPVSGERTRELHELYNLSELLPRAEELEHAEGSLSGRNRELLDTVSTAIKEDLLRVKDGLDLHLRQDAADLAGLMPLADELDRVADTLGMLGLGVPRNLILKQKDTVEDVANQRREADEKTLLDVAGALLYVEASLDDHIDSLGKFQPSEVEGSAEAADNLFDLPQSEVRRILDALVKEAKGNLAAVKNAVVAFIESPWDHDQLLDAPARIGEVSGALRMLDLPRPADYLDALSHYFRDELLQKRVVPEPEQLDQLADAVASIEYYLEGVREQRPQPQSILNVALESLRSLGYEPGVEPDAASAGDVGENVDRMVAEFAAVDSDAEAAEELPDDTPHGEDAEALVAEPPELADLSPDVDDPVAEVPALLDEGEAAVAEGFAEFAEGDADLAGGEGQAVDFFAGASLEEVAAEEPADGSAEDVAAEEAAEVSAEEETAEVSAEDVAAEETAEVRADDIAEAPGVATEAADDPTPEVADVPGEDTEAPTFVVGEVDPDIRDIFVEEFEEELEAQAEHYPQWRQDPANQESLSVLRRSFHTLKGSGRLVGAVGIGEFAWKVEDLLNPLLDEDASPSDCLLAAMDHVHAVMPQMFRTLTEGVQPTTNVAALEDVLTRLSDGEEAWMEADLGASAPAVSLKTANPDQADADTSEESTEPEPLDEAAAGSLEPDTTASVETLDADQAVVSLGEMDQEDGEPAAEPASEAAEPASDLALELEVEPPAEAREPAPEPEFELEVEPASEEQEALSAGIDPVLLDILKGEVDAHVGVIGAFADDESQPMEPAMRAAHTLTGAVAMVSVPQLTTLCEPMERYVKALHARGERPDEAGGSALRDALGQIRSIVANLANDSELPDVEPAAARLTELYERLPPAPAEPTLADLDAAGALSGDAESQSLESTDGLEPALDAAPPEVPEPVQDAAPELPDSAPSEAADSDVDHELLDIFVQEAEEILDAAERLMSQLRDDPKNGEAITGLQRELHTLKGGARMAGLTPIGDLSHVMESLFEAVVEQQRALDDDALSALEGGFDRLHNMVQTVRALEPVPDADSAIAAVEALLGEVPDQTQADRAAQPSFEPSPAAPDVPVEAPEAADVTEDILGEPVMAAPSRPAAEEILEKALAAKSDIGQMSDSRTVPESTATGPRPQQEIIRVRSELLDSLVNYAGEVSIYRSRLEQQVGSFRFNLIEFDQTVSRLREQLRNLEMETETQILSRFQREAAEHEGDFDPLEMDRFSQIQELSRALAESVSDLVSIQNLLDDTTRQSETLLLQQSRVSSDLQEGLMRTRMVPFDSLVPRLRRILRQTSNELGKKAQLRVTGAQGEMDRTVLERITAPLEHMLRNALAHGLEGPEARADAGKDETGTINITVSREATEVVLQVADDGAGIDRDVVRAKAVERGLLHEGAELSDRDIYGFILETGFSTAEQVTKVSGRGVGMDVVNSEIKQLGGSLDIDSVPGKGTVFTIRLPFTLAVTHAIMVRVGEQSYAVPLSSVQGVVRLHRDEFARRIQAGETTYSYAGEPYQIQELHTLLGQGGHGSAEDDQIPILMIRSGDQRAAIRVDAVTGSREVVVKSVGPQVASVPGIFGATILGDGRVILILDLGPLVRRGAALKLAPEAPSADPDAPSRRPLVMVVDDSITMRKVTTRVLERNDMDVVTAKDGVDAVAALQERVPDLMLLDIEMPRMDGYELASHMRNDGRLQEIPIIMITSRTGEKHRQRAEEIGVERYLGKPYQEAELMEHVGQLLSERFAVTS